jgi:DNA-binding IclR family transcriptional regulator
MSARVAAYPGAQTVARAIAVLKAFTDADPHLTLAEVSHAVRLNKATAYRLLNALEIEGLVARDDGAETYRLGPEAIALGSRALRANDLRSVSRAELEGLAGHTGETATLEVLTGSEVLILDEVRGEHLVGSTQSVGTRWPAHATSTGKVLLAHLPKSVREAALRRRFARRTARTITTSGALRRELARIRARGYATAIEEIEEGFCAVGAPVRDHTGVVVAALSLGGPRTRLTADKLADYARLVQAAARRISKKLGYKEK